MTQIFKFILISLALFTFLSCSKDEEKVTINGVWKMLTYVNKECLDPTDNIDINFTNGCIQDPVNEETIACWEFRFENSKMISILTLKNKNTGEIEEDIEEGFFKLKNNNSVISFCDDQNLLNCDVDYKIVLSAKLLSIHFPNGYDTENCFSILTLSRP